MEEQNQPIIEGEQNLNNNEKTSYTLEEVEEIKRKMQSDSEKWVQKLINEKKAYDEVFNHLSDISDNPSNLVKLYEEKPEVAKIILDKYYDWIDIEDFKENIDYKKDYTDPKEIEKIIEKWVNKKMETKLIEEKKEAFIKKLKLTEEQKKDFNEAFNERRKLSSFSLENLEKIFEKSYRDIDDVDISKLEDYKKNEEQAQIMASSWGTTEQKVWKLSITDPNNKTRKEVSSFFKKFKTE